MSYDVPEYGCSSDPVENCPVHTPELFMVEYREHGGFVKSFGPLRIESAEHLVCSLAGTVILANTLLESVKIVPYEKKS